MFKFINSKRLPIWYLAIALPVVLEPVALIFQYVLDYGPYILCVQIRATLIAMLIAGIAGISVSCKAAQKGLSLALVGITGVFAYQSFMVLGIERYWFEGSCTMDAPFRIGCHYTSGYHQYSNLGNYAVIPLKLFLVSPWQKH